MNKTKSVWGGVAGKIIATLMVLSVICGAVTVTLAYSVYGDSLLSKDEIKVISSIDNKNGTINIKLRLEKPGYYLSDYKTEKVGDKLMVKLYSSVREGDIKADSTGAYTLDFKVDTGVKSVVQEGPDGEEYILVKVNIAS